MAVPQLKAAPADTPERVFFAAVLDETTREVVRQAARQCGWANPEMSEGGVQAADAFIRAHGPPAALVVDVADSPEAVLDVASLAHACGGATTIIAIGLANDVRLYRRLREVGAVDYLVKPLSADLLAEALAEAARPRAREMTTPKVGRVVAMIGSRGGVGVTTLAISAGWLLAQQHQRVTLLDLDLHFGSAALSLDLEPGRGLRELLAHPDRIDSLLLDAAVTHAGDRLRLLSAEEPLEESLHLGPEGLVAVVHQLKAGADFVIVDLPRTLGPLTREMFTLADTICLITDLSLPAMRDTQRLVALIKSLRDEAKTMIIANRLGGVGGEVSVADFERGVGAKIAQTIPFDRQAAIAAAEGAKPFSAVARNPKTATAMRTLVSRLTGSEMAQAPSFLRRLLGR